MKPTNQQLFFLVEIVAGGGFSGLFVYSGLPATGNLIASIAANAGFDPYGNVYEANVTAYNKTGGAVGLGASSSGGVEGITFWANTAGDEVHAYNPYAEFVGGLTGVQVQMLGRLTGNISQYFAVNDRGSSIVALNFVVPSGDMTGVADTAQINAFFTAGAQYVCLLPGTFYINAALKVPSYATLAGSGYSTIVEAVAGFTDSYMVQLATPASTVRATIRDMLLSPQTGTVGGVLIDNTGWPGGANLPTLKLNDTLHTLHNILVIGAGGDSFHFDNAVREARVSECISYNAAGDGFYIGDASGAGGGCTDSHFTDCTAGHSALHGFYVLDANNMFTACKSWGSGYSSGSISGTTEAGFYIVGSGSGHNATRNTFTGCQAQQNALNGFHLDNCFQVNVIGCDSDSNSAGTGVTTGVGIYIDTSTQCTITANSGNQALTPGAQLYGIQTAGVCAGTWIGLNSCTGTATTFHAGTGINYTLLDNTNITDFTHVNNFRMGTPEFYEGPAQVSVTSGTTIVAARNQGCYSLTPGALGAITGLIVSTSNAVAGMTAVFINTSTTQTMTFDIPGTSNVAQQSGANVTILPGQTVTLTWDTFTSLWYVN